MAAMDVQVTVITIVDLVDREVADEHTRHRYSNVRSIMSKTARRTQKR